MRSDSRDRSTSRQTRPITVVSRTLRLLQVKRYCVCLLGGENHRFVPRSSLFLWPLLERYGLTEKGHRIRPRIAEVPVCHPHDVTVDHDNLN